MCSAECSIVAISSCCFTFQEIVLKRAADLAEALYSMPSRGNLAQPRSPSMSSTAMSNYNNGYSQLTVSEHDPTNNGQWKDGKSLCRCEDYKNELKFVC